MVVRREEITQEQDSGQGNGREFTFTDRDFNFIRKLVGERTGINLSDAKRDMVYGRLTRRIRQLDSVDSFKEYCELLKDGDETELIEFTNAITTNLTSFFREPHHFEFLAKKLLPELMKKKLDRRLRIWSAGCSSGEEPYSIAMQALESLPLGWQVKITATDVDTDVLAKARTGVYPVSKLDGISQEIKHYLLYSVFICSN